MEIPLKNNPDNRLEHSILKEGTFYTLKEDNDYIIMEDKTKKGLTPQERSPDENYNVLAEKGIIYDMDGIGHKVGIRWYFSKNYYDFEKVLEHALEIEDRYRKIRQETCPDY